MKGLTTQELVGMRACAMGALPDICTLRRRTSAVDALGSDVPTWGTVSYVPCKLTPNRGLSHSVEGAQYAAHAEWSVALPYDQALSPGDEIIHASTTYSVMSVDESPSWRTIRRANLRRVE